MLEKGERCCSSCMQQSRNHHPHTLNPDSTSASMNISTLVMSCKRRSWKCRARTCPRISISGSFKRRKSPGGVENASQLHPLFTASPSSLMSPCHAFILLTDACLTLRASKVTNIRSASARFCAVTRVHTGPTWPRRLFLRTKTPASP